MSALFRLLTAGFVTLGGALGCAHARAAPERPPARAHRVTAASPYLVSAGREAERAGGSPLEELATGAGIPGDSLSAFVVVPKGRCALVVARGAAGVEDLDLYLFSDDGEELATSDDTLDPPTLLHCAPERLERLLAVARVAAGRGPYALGLVDAPLAEEARLRERMLPKRREPARAEDFPGFDAGLQAHRDMLGGTWRDVRRVLLPVDHRLPTQVDFSLTRERCMDAFVLPGAQVEDLDVEALDSGGRTIARAEAHGGERALLVCAGADPGAVTLRLRPHAGRGVVVLALSETTVATALRDLHPEFPRHDLSPGPGPLPTLPPAGRRLDLAVDRVTAHSLSWTGCQRVELEPRWPLLGYQVAAYDAGGQLVAEHAGTAAARLYLCLPKSAGGEGHLQLRATSRAGPLDVQSLAETVPAAPALERAPLAASRLLGLASDLGFLRSAADIGQVSLHELGPDRLVRIPLLVPAQRCVSILVAAQRSGRGLELGLVDSSTARYVDFARGSSVASVRTCGARGRTEDLVVEIRAPHGETSALVSTRQEELDPAD